MKKRTKIKVVDADYKLLYFDSMGQVSVQDNGSLRGQCVNSACEVRIYEVPGNERETWNTIWHELLHAIEDKMGIVEIQDHKRRESIISCLATGINAICWDNKLDFSQ